MRQDSVGGSKADSWVVFSVSTVQCDHTIDITYIRLSREFVYLAVILDWFSRYVRAWNISVVSL